MKPYLPTLALATLLLSNSSAVLAAPAPQAASHTSHKTESTPVFTAGMVLMPRYNVSDHALSATFPLLGVPPVPEADWLWSGSKVYADGKWTLNPAWLGLGRTRLHTHVAVSWSDVEDKLLADHVYVSLQAGRTHLKVGRYPPFVQPRMLGVSSVLLASILADDHWHVDGVQLSHRLTDSLKLTLGGYTDGAYLGSTAEVENGNGRMATSHVAVQWQPKNAMTNAYVGLTANILHSPDVVRIAKLKTHTHGSVLAECQRDVTTCVDGNASLLWLHGFWHYHGNSPSSNSNRMAMKKPRYGVDSILTLQDISGKLNTDIASVDVDSKQWNLMLDVFYQPAKAKYTLRAETMQMQHHVNGLNARQTAKTVGIENNSHNPWRIGVQADYPLVKGLMLSPAVFWDNTRQGDAGAVFSVGLHYKLTQGW